MAKRKQPPDVAAFAAEMRQAAEDHRQTFIGTFREEWKARLERDKPRPVVSSSLHLHDADCWGPPHMVQIAGKTWVNVRRCVVSGTVKEVTA